jgi:hypothetical protein
MSLVVLSCASLSLLATVIAREKLREAASLFFVLSLAVLANIVLLRT